MSDPKLVLEPKPGDVVPVSLVVPSTCWCGKQHEFGVFCARPGEEGRVHEPFCEEKQ